MKPSDSTVMGYKSFISPNTKNLGQPGFIKSRIIFPSTGSFTVHFERLVLCFSQVLKLVPASLGITGTLQANGSWTKIQYNSCTSIIFSGKAALNRPRSNSYGQHKCAPNSPRCSAACEGEQGTTAHDTLRTGTDPLGFPVPWVREKGGSVLRTTFAQYCRLQ